jgi:DNA-binding HxlR family transcriptional regulator
MATLQTAVNKLKCRFSEHIENDYIVANYGLKSCKDNILNTLNNLKLQIIFLDNLAYIPLTVDQLRRIVTGNYKDVIKTKTIAQELEELNDAMNVEKYQTVPSPTEAGLSASCQTDDDCCIDISLWAQTDF